MGIGNQLAFFRSQHLILLITPHGDWEPESAMKIETALSSHYPSWGLGTAASVMSLNNGEPAHYPSWGLGTRL